MYRPKEAHLPPPLLPTNYTPTNHQDSCGVAFVAASLSPPVPRKLTSVELGLRQGRDVGLVRLIDAAKGGVVSVSLRILSDSGYSMASY